MMSIVWLIFFEPGDLVLLYHPRRRNARSPKITSSWESYFLVLNKLIVFSYRIKLGSKQTKPKFIHRNRLWNYQGDQTEIRI